MQIVFFSPWIFLSITAKGCQQEGWRRYRGWSKESSQGRWASQPFSKTPLLASATGNWLIVASYTALISVTQWRSRRFNIQYFLVRYCGAWSKIWDQFLYTVPCNGLQGAVAHYAANQTRNTGANPLPFLISALGSFSCITQHMGPTASSHLSFCFIVILLNVFFSLSLSLSHSLCFFLNRWEKFKKNWINLDPGKAVTQKRYSKKRKEQSLKESWTLKLASTHGKYHLHLSKSIEILEFSTVCSNQMDHTFLEGLTY